MAEPISVILLAMLAAFLVGMSKGGLPAVGALAVPLMALVMSPILAAALLLPIFCATDLVGLWLYRRIYSGRNLAILIPAGVIGVGIGWAIAAHVSDSFVGMLVGLTGIGFCLRVWLAGRKGAVAPRPADLPGGLFWGALTGFTSFVSHSGAPPFQMYVLPQKLEKLVFAGTATITFAVINAAKIIPYWELDSFSAVDGKLALLILPVGIAGTFAGAKLTRIIPDGLFFRLVQVTLFAISLKLVADALLSMARS
ncbi:sulfite exporter TauE/SafE family protein [Amaricoccus solimangrovi]|uniref:Probable membrane transporter protein n=1 Tax=Amaricoccus solimangrovi TaxID=2589815 RepID=A0A501WY67_9RHOB|nr:sulfite exporter TauE/SafE family protein [Amaricoccus solimangrovi]TPE53205.1 sulfite exporter TauE/SafE family protein [Amaricoccus solimangrovi]